MQSDQNLPEMHDTVGLSSVLANIVFEISSLQSFLHLHLSVEYRIGMPKCYFHFRSPHLHEKIAYVAIGQYKLQNISKTPISHIPNINTKTTNINLSN